MQVVQVCALALVLVGCATTAGSLHATTDFSDGKTNFGTRPDEIPSTVPAAAVESDSPALVAVEYHLAASGDSATPVLVAQAASIAEAAQADAIEEEYDP